QTPLMAAAIFGHDEIVSLLLAAGADVQLKDDLGLTALDWSVRRGFSNVGHLLDSAASPNGSRSVTNGNSYSQSALNTFAATADEEDAERELRADQLPANGAETVDSPKARVGIAGLAMLRSRANQISDENATTEVAAWSDEAPATVDQATDSS